MSIVTGELSPQQDKLMRFLHDFKKGHDYGPGIKDFCEALGVAKSVVKYHLDPLVNMGYIDGRPTETGQIAPNTWHLTELGLEYLQNETIPD